MSRNTHHRVRDHFGFDYDTNVILNGDVGATISGSTVHDALDDVWQGSSEVNFIIDGGGAVVTSGIHGDIEMPYAGIITRVSLLANISGSAVVDLWKDVYANFPPTNADSITASAKPTLASAVKYEDNTLTGWTKTFAAGDIIRVNVDSLSTITRLTLALRVRRTA